MSSNVLLGGAIGDALGVPFETKLANYQPLLDWDGKTFLGSAYHKLLPGQYSDDGQMSIIVATSLIENNGFNPDNLAKRYVQWITSGEARGYGKTTMMAIQHLMAGKHWRESGIAGSHGNGTAMRSAPFGVYYRDDLETLIKVVKIDNAITHASDEAEAGAVAIALAAAYAARNETEDLLEKIYPHLPDCKVKKTIYSLGTLVSSPYIPPAQALQVLGTKADVRETVPSALYCFLKFSEYHQAVETAIRAGGDTDTTAAIVGALFGAKLGMEAINGAFYLVEDFDRIVGLDRQLFNRTRNAYFPRI